MNSTSSKGEYFKEKEVTTRKGITKKREGEEERNSCREDALSLKGGSIT